MSTEKETILKQIAELEDQKKPLQKRLNEIRKQEEDEVDEKVKRCNQLQDKFNLDELRFSATARCACGAGLAYPKNIGIRGAWFCSDILLGRALPASDPNSKQHDEAFPFAFYEIKSEDQPSAQGMTTRPKECETAVNETTQTN